MAQPWYMELKTPEPELPELETPKRSTWYWIKQTGLFPLRILGLICAFALLIGSFSMWVIPNMADRYKTDMMLLVLRAIDQEGPARPFRHFDPDRRIAAGLIDLTPDVDSSSAPAEADPALNQALKDRVVEITSKKKGGSIYVVRYASGKTKKIAATTPHLKVPRRELAEARQAIARFYSPRDKKRWQAVRSWGESLLATSWIRHFGAEFVTRGQIPGPPEGTEDEHIWCVWQALRSGGAGEEDLERLPELFRQSFPSKQDREAALAWADNLHQRLDRNFSYAHKAYYQGTSPSDNNLSARLYLYQSFRRVLPPDKGWTRLWLLQQYVGLSPAAREVARQRWLGYFPASKHEQVEELGKSLGQQRREKGEPLPNAPEVVPALCVIERLLGTDADGAAACEAVAKLPNQKLLLATLTLAYPNDDLFYMAAAGNPLELFPYGGRGEGTVYYTAFTGFILFMTFVTGLGIQAGLRWFIVPLVLGKKTRPLWDKHENGRGDESFLLSVLSILVFAGIGFLLAPYSLSELVLVQVGSPLQLFFGAVIATAIGGLLIATVRRIAALFLIACGVDIEETYADEILGIIGGAFVLYHFGNDWIAITLFILSDLGPGLVLRGWRRLRSRRSSTSPASTAVLSYP